MSSQLSAQAITAHTAITRIASRRCRILPRQGGSSTAPKCCTRLLIVMTCLSIRKADHHASNPVRQAKSHALALELQRHDRVLPQRHQAAPADAIPVPGLKKCEAIDVEA